jgi:DNA polymerase III subunit epsilon
MNWLARLLPGRSEVTPLPPALQATLATWQALPAPDLSAPHFDTRYVVVNTEATGPNPGDRLLAVAAICIDGGLLNPRQSFYARLDSAPEDALAGLLAFIGKSPVVVYGAGFNRQLLELAWQHQLGIETDLAWLDLYWLLPALFRPERDAPTRLAQWMKIFGIETFQRHHALGDAWVIAQLFLALQGRATRQGATSARTLLELERKRRLFTTPA